MHVLGKARTPASKATQPARRTPQTRPPAVTEQPAALSQDALTDLLGNHDEVIALLLWKARHRNPDLFEKITPADISAFRACTEYLKIEPKVVVERPPGAPAMPPLPATATRSATPGRPAEGPRPYVIVQLVDQNGNAFMPIENNEDDRRRQEAAERLRRIRDTANELGARVLNAGRTENYVLSELEQLVEGFLLLAKAQA